MADDTTRLGPEEVVERRTTRRELVRKGAAGALVVAYGGALSKTSAYGAPRYAGKQLAGTLRIMQWSHFVPAYDKWFDGTYVKQWGQRNDTEVIVDHVNLAELPARAAAEVSAQSGHDLFQVLSPPAAFEDQVISHNEIVQEITRKVGKMGRVGYKSTYNPKTKKYFGVPGQLRPRPGALPAGHLAQRRAGAELVGRHPAVGRGPQERRAPGRDRDVPGARLEHGQHGPDDVLRRVPPEPGEPRHAPQRRHDQRAAGDARHLPQRDDAGGLRLDRGLEQPGVHRRPALARAERDLDRAHARRAAVGDDAGPRRAERATRGSRRSPAGRRSGWGSST